MLDTKTNAVTKLPAGALHLWSAIKTRDTLYVTHVQDATVAAINLDTQAIHEIHTGSMPDALVEDRSTGEVCVANYQDGSVSIIDERSATVLTTVKTPGHPQALAVDVEKGLLYAANTRESTVSIIDLHELRVMKTINAGSHPYAIAVDTGTHKVYAANMGGTPFTLLSLP